MKKTKTDITEIKEELLQIKKQLNRVWEIVSRLQETKEIKNIEKNLE